MSHPPADGRILRAPRQQKEAPQWSPAHSVEPAHVKVARTVPSLLILPYLLHLGLTRCRPIHALTQHAHLKVAPGLLTQRQTHNQGKQASLKPLDSERQDLLHVHFSWCAFLQQ
eukprot:scaffold101301_cov15-Tisochrysis_lutea.AAC.1